MVFFHFLFPSKLQTMRRSPFFLSPSPVGAGEENWNHKRQRSQIEIRTIYQKHQLNKKTNSNSINNRSVQGAHSYLNWSWILSALLKRQHFSKNTQHLTNRAAVSSCLWRHIWKVWIVRWSQLGASGYHKAAASVCSSLKAWAKPLQSIQVMLHTFSIAAISVRCVLGYLFPPPFPTMDIYKSD